MATQTGSFDFKSTKAAKESAEKVATNFVATDTSGMMVYDGTGGTHTPSNPGTDTRNVLIDSDSVDIRQGTTVLSTFGATTRIGKNNSENVTIGSGEVAVNTSAKSGAVRLSSVTHDPNDIRGIISLGGTDAIAPSIEGGYDTNTSFVSISSTAKSNTSAGSSLNASGNNGGYARVDASATSGSGTCNLRANDNNNTSQIQVISNQISLTSSDITLYGTPRVSRSTGYSEAFYYASHDAGGTIGLGVTSGGTQGVYNSTQAGWIIREDSQDVHIGRSGTNTVIDANATVNGSITVSGHNSPIGWYDGHNNTTSVASGSSFTSVSGSSITLSPGRYVLTASASFAGNTTGYRGIGFYSNSLITEGSTIQVAIPSTSWATRVGASLIRNVEASETISLALVQNSGSALSTQWYIKAIRIV